MQTNRRKFLTGLTAGTAIAGLPAVTEVKRLSLSPGDAVVIRHPGRLTHEAHRNLDQAWKHLFPGIRAIVLEDGMDIEILRRA